MNANRLPHAVLFDLDGTLADTAPDLAFALNRTLQHFRRDVLPYEVIRPVVSHGGIALIRLGFGLAPDAPGFEERRQFLLDVYADNLCRETGLFPGMAAVLAGLEAQRIPWGVVTNKPAWLTDPLIVAMQLDRRAGCVVSGDTCARRKPHPDPILHACRLLHSDPCDTWYVGDAGRDMQAGKAAGCITIGALYGYLHPEDPPHTWQTDLTIDQPEQLLDLLPNDISVA
jgi:phosphoglycolate phosphatase